MAWSASIAFIQGQINGAQSFLPWFVGAFIGMYLIEISVSIISRKRQVKVN